MKSKKYTNLKLVSIFKDGTPTKIIITLLKSIRKGEAMKRIDLFFTCFVLIGCFLLLGGSVIFSSQNDAATSTSIGFFLGGGISCLIGLAGLLFCKKE